MHFKVKRLGGSTRSFRCFGDASEKHAENGKYEECLQKQLRS